MRKESGGSSLRPIFYWRLSQIECLMWSTNNSSKPHKPGLVYHKCDQGFVVVVVVNGGAGVCADACGDGTESGKCCSSALVVFPAVTIVCIVALFAASVSEPNQLVNSKFQMLEHVKIPKIFMSKEWQEAICRPLSLDHCPLYNPASTPLPPCPLLWIDSTWYVDTHIHIHTRWSSLFARTLCVVWLG